MNKVFNCVINTPCTVANNTKCLFNYDDGMVCLTLENYNLPIKPDDLARQRKPIYRCQRIKMINFVSFPYHGKCLQPFRGEFVVQFL
jgi:hypothetical protein